MRYFPVVAALLLACSCVKSPKSRGKIVMMAINDVYRIEGAGGGTDGGLARVRTLRRSLEQKNGPVPLFHAGDALSPNIMSTRFKSRQMIDILNLMDGRPRAFDPYMVMTFGNHEFDLRSASQLDDRVDESEFTWLASNIRFKKDSRGRDLIQAPHLKTNYFMELKGVKIGVFSLTIDMKTPDYVAGFSDLERTARSQTAELRASGAEVVIALTHLNASQDEALLRSLGAEGPDLIIGGHDHQSTTMEVNGRWLLKADSEARTAMVIEIDRDSRGLLVQHRLVALDARVTGDGLVEKRIGRWQAQFDPKGIFLETVGYTREELVAEELTIRRFETNLGNWVTDQMRSALPAEHPAIALINAGSLRLNDNIPAQSNISLGQIEQLLPFETRLHVVRMRGKAIRSVLQRSVSDWSGSGHWLQVSGLRFDHYPSKELADNIHVFEEGGWKPLRPDGRYLVVTSDFLAAGGDEYPQFLEAEPISQGPDLKEWILHQLSKAAKKGISPRVDGRILNQEKDR